jgi:hypothetical protein
MVAEVMKWCGSRLGKSFAASDVDFQDCPPGLGLNGKLEIIAERHAASLTMSGGLPINLDWPCP